VAIGDFVIAMGTVDENDVLEARRILVTDTLEPTSRTIKLGKITLVDETDDSITIEGEGSEAVVVIDRNTDIITTLNGEDEVVDLAQLERGNTVVVVTTLDDEETVTRTIYLIPVTDEVQTEPTESEEEI
jgi:hypothetical protein